MTLELVQEVNNSFRLVNLMLKTIIQLRYGSYLFNIFFIYSMRQIHIFLNNRPYTHFFHLSKNTLSLNDLNKNTNLLVFSDFIFDHRS